MLNDEAFQTMRWDCKNDNGSLGQGFLHSFEWYVGITEGSIAFHKLMGDAWLGNVKRVFGGIVVVIAEEMTEGIRHVASSDDNRMDHGERNKEKKSNDVVKGYTESEKKDKSKNSP